MKKQIKPEITRIVREKTRIVEFEATKLVTKIGTGAHVLLPKELIGKIIKINFSEKQIK